MRKLTKKEVTQKFQFCMRNPDLSRDPTSRDYVVDALAAQLMDDYNWLTIDEAYNAIYKYTNAMKLEERANPKAEEQGSSLFD